MELSAFPPELLIRTFQVFSLCNAENVVTVSSDKPLTWKIDFLVCFQYFFLSFCCLYLSLWVFVCVLQDRIHIENGALTVVSVNLSDAGMYQCVAENKHGVIYFSTELVVLGKIVHKTFLFLIPCVPSSFFLLSSFPSKTFTLGHNTFVLYWCKCFWSHARVCVCLIRQGSPKLLDLKHS